MPGWITTARCGLAEVAVLKDGKVNAHIYQCLQPLSERA